MIGNDLETSKVSLSVLFCIIEKNALSKCKGITFSLFYDKYSKKLIAESFAVCYWTLFKIPSLVKISKMGIIFLCSKKS